MYTVAASLQRTQRAMSRPRVPGTFTQLVIRWPRRAASRLASSHNRFLRLSRSIHSMPSCEARSMPAFAGRLHDQTELGRLAVPRDVVAVDRAGEAALRRDRELPERNMAFRLVNAAYQVGLGLQLADLGGHEPEDHDFAF